MNFGKVYLFLDESGDLGKRGNRYFCVSILSTIDPRKVELVMKRIRQRKLKKRLKQVPELKGNNSSESIRRAVLAALAKLPSARFSTILVDKQKIFDYLFDKKDKLYNYVAGSLIDLVDLQGYRDVELVYDRRSSNSLLTADFENYLRRKLTERKFDANLVIYGLQSHQSRGLMAADYVSWSVYRKYNWGDESYFKIIEDKTDIRRLWE